MLRFIFYFLYIMEQVKVILGRFQPMTLGHLKITTYKDFKGPDAEQRKNLREQPDLNKIKNQRTVILVVSTPENKIDARHPFNDALRAKEFDIIKRNYSKDIADILYVTSADICAWGELIKSHGYQASVWITGSDEFPKYKGMVAKVPQYEISNRGNYDCKDAYTRSFYLESVQRSDASDDFISTISATKVRQALINNDKAGFKKMMPRGTDKLFNEFRDAVMRVTESQTLQESLANYLRRMLLEGGHVFGEGSDKIKKEYIKPTLDRFIQEFVSIFPNVKNHFDKPTILGSAGKKDYSGDIDLAIDEKCFKDIDDWGLDKKQIDIDYEKYKKRARTATPEQLMRRAIISNIAKKVQEKSDNIAVSDKSASNGVLFCEYDQYDETGKKLPLRVQIDINFGDVDWLSFAYYSDTYPNNVKGLHRTQLMLHMFSYKNYIFGHSYGVKNKTTQEIVAKTPEEAIQLLNSLYNIHLNEKILQNYSKLQEYLRKTLDPSTLNEIYDIYLKTLDSTRCDIPEDLQQYWLENQDRLKLTGKFLPNDSRLYPHRK